MSRVPDNMDWDAVRRRFARADPEKYEPGDRPRTEALPGLYQNLRSLGGVPASTQEWVLDWYAGGYLRYTQELVDYSAWAFNEWVRRGFCRGIYLDDCWNTKGHIQTGHNQLFSAVTYRLPDGHGQPGFDWRNQRQYLRRLRQLFYDHGLTPHMCVHLTHTQYPMWLSFFDVMYDGEDHDRRPAGHPTDFMDYWTPFRLRFHNSQKFGVAPYFHGWVGDSMKARMGKMPTWSFKQQRAYAGALMAHDLGWLNREAFASALGATWDEWARPNMLSRPENVLVPYWDPQPVAPNSPKGLYVTAWKRDGWCAVAIANWSTNRVHAELTLDLAAMGFGDVAPEALTIRDVDANLISYFDEDVTKLKMPTLSGLALLNDAPADFELDEPPTLAERKAADPDGQYEWKDGVLRGPVRPHDFRLFEFKTPAQQ